MNPLPDLRGVQAVLFDMDGTLVLSEDRTDRAVVAFLRSRGVAPGEDLDLAAFHGVTWAAIGDALARRWTGLGSVDIAAALQRRFHDSFLSDPPPPVPGAFRAVAAAAAAAPTAIVTSSNRETLEVVCDQLDLHRWVAASVTAEDCTRSKPSPEPFTLAAERLGVDPRRCLVFEDSGAGVQAATAAGATVIAIGPESGHEPWIPDYRRLDDDFFERACGASHG